MNITDRIEQYLGRRKLQGPWRLEGCCTSRPSGAVVIPALAENETLPLTLADLAAQDPAELVDWVVVVVVNHRTDSDERLKIANREVLTWLRQRPFGSKLPLLLLDAASPGAELPVATGGVGLARKLGADLALDVLQPAEGAMLVYLDADTRVPPGYLPAIRRHLATSREPAAVLPFRHQPGSTEAEDHAINRYELFLRGYVLGLSLAGSPYAFHTIGSAMACRVGAYLAIGGMNQRKAAEDFHFLQQLAKHAGVGLVRGTRVFPSARPSSRVPFGTGMAVTRQLSGEAGQGVYPAAPFEILGRWLTVVTEGPDLCARELLSRAEVIDSRLAVFLRDNQWPDVWPKLQANNPSSARRAAAFHGWFDGLQSLRLIHHLLGGAGKGRPAEEALPELLAWGGLPAGDTLQEQLAILRGHQTPPDQDEAA